MCILITWKSRDKPWANCGKIMKQRFKEELL